MSDQIKLEKNKIVLGAVLFNINLLRINREKQPNAEFVLFDQDKSKTIGKDEYQKIEEQIDLVIGSLHELTNLVAV